MQKRTAVRNTLCLAAALLVGVGAWMRLPGQSQHSVKFSASASVGRFDANTSASAQLTTAETFTTTAVSPPPTVFYNQQSAVTLIVNDINSDLNPDITILVTTPPLPAGTAAGAVARRTRHGVFTLSGSTGAVLTNTVTSQAGDPGS